MKFDAVIFDWNGTVIDDVDGCYQILCEILARYGVKPVTYDEYREAFGFPIIEYYKKVGFVFENYTFEEVASHFVPMYDKTYPKCKLYDGIVDLIKRLKRDGVKVYLLSATQDGSLKEQTEYFKLDGLFDVIIGTDNFHGKSKMEEGRYLSRVEKLESKNVLLVGDTEYDYQVAQEIGVDCALLDYGHKPRKTLSLYTKNVFSSVKELEDFIYQ
ncbi:MAG: HAD family hydrolase [Clostridia bacterium]|nr:HAD family hydrolase [Clostridia bacterium]